MVNIVILFNGFLLAGTIFQ